MKLTTLALFVLTISLSVEVMFLERRVDHLQQDFIDYATAVNKFMDSTNTSMTSTQQSILNLAQGEEGLLETMKITEQR